MFKINPIYHEIQLSFGTSDVKRTVIKQNSENTHILQIKLYDKQNNEMTIDNNWNIHISALKGDKTHVFNTNNVSVCDNAIQVMMTKQMLSASGTEKCELVIQEDDNVLFSDTFLIYVEPNIQDGSFIESSSEYDSIMDTLNQVQERKEQVDKLSDEIEETIQKVNDAADDLQDKLDSHHFVLTEDKDTANGVPSLDVNTKVPNTQLYEATITGKGITQLTDSVSSDSTTTAATPNSVKAAYEKAMSIESDINTNRANWNDKYTKNQVDNKFSALETNIDWKESVETYDDIFTTYPNPVDGWTVNVKDTDYTYRYNGTGWVVISANAIPKATNDVDGLLSREDHEKYEEAFNTAKIHAESTHAPVNAEANQNAFSHIAVGSTTISANNTTDTLNLAAGSNITITPDAENDRITISSNENSSLSSNNLEIGLNKLNYFLSTGNQNPSYVVTESSEDTMYINNRGAQRTSSEKALFVKFNSTGGSCGYALVGLTAESVGTSALTAYGDTIINSRTTPSGITYYISQMGSAWSGAGSSGGTTPVTVTVSGKTFNIVKSIYNLYPGQENCALALDVLVDIVLVSGYSAESIHSAVLSNYYSTRPASANLTPDGSGGLYTFKATSSMTEGKPPTDAHILHFSWDNTQGFDSQLGICNTNGNLYTRGCSAGTWCDWKTILDSSNCLNYKSKSVYLYPSDDTSISDFNNFTDGMWKIDRNSSMTNSPTGRSTEHGYLFQSSNMSANMKMASQIFIQYNSNAIYTRNCWYDTWQDWTMTLTNKNYMDYALPLSGGTLNGNLTTESSVYAGDKVGIFTNNEGGNIDLKSANNTYGYQFDAYNDTYLRCYCYQVSPWSLKSSFNFNTVGLFTVSGDSPGFSITNGMKFTGVNDTGYSATHIYATSMNYPHLLLRQFSNVFQFFPNVTYSSEKQVHLGHTDFRLGDIIATNVYNSSGIITTSDRNKKHDIELITKEFAAKIIDGLIPSSFKFNDGSSGRTHFGIIAQDLENQLSDLDISSTDFAPLVKQYPDKEVTVENPDYNPDDSESPYYITRLEKDYESEPIYNIRYEEFIMILVKYCQELRKENTSIKNKLLNLENSIRKITEQTESE